MRLESLYAPRETGTVTGAADGIEYKIVDGIVTVPYANRTALIAAGYVPVPDSEPNAAPSTGGGGATKFVDLTDCPATITANALLVGNAAGNGVVQSGHWKFVIDDTLLEATGAAAEGVALSLDMWVQADGQGNVNAITASEAYVSSANVPYANLQARVKAADNGVAGLSIDVVGAATAAETRVEMNFIGGIPVMTGLPTADPAVENALVSLNKMLVHSGFNWSDVRFTGLPTSDPSIAGAPYLTAGALMISAG